MSPIRAVLRLTILAALVATASAPAVAASPRQSLTEAAFLSRDKQSALALIGEAQRAAAAAVAREPANREARLLQAMAIGYRGKLTRNRGDALAARRQFEALAAADPRDAETAAAIGTWHLDSILELGGFVGGMALGAKKATGLAMMDRAVALGGRRAFYTGLAGMLRVALDPEDARGRALIEAAAAAPAPEPLDRQMQAGAAALLPLLRQGGHQAVERLARELLPFGRTRR